MPRAGFGPATAATKRPQTYALDSEATGISCKLLITYLIFWIPLLYRFYTFSLPDTKYSEFTNEVK
jgi:hypothetical protein